VCPQFYLGDDRQREERERRAENRAAELRWAQLFAGLARTSNAAGSLDGGTSSERRTSDSARSPFADRTNHRTADTRLSTCDDRDDGDRNGERERSGERGGAARPLSAVAQRDDEGGGGDDDDDDDDDETNRQFTLVAALKRHLVGQVQVRGEFEGGRRGRSTAINHIDATNIAETLAFPDLLSLNCGDVRGALEKLFLFKEPPFKLSALTLAVVSAKDDLGSVNRRPEAHLFLFWTF
jgi:hypothetical protein